MSNRRSIRRFVLLFSAGGFLIAEQDPYRGSIQVIILARPHIPVEYSQENDGYTKTYKNEQCNDDHINWPPPNDGPGIYQTPPFPESPFVWDEQFQLTPAPAAANSYHRARQSRTR